MLTVILLIILVLAVIAGIVWVFVQFRETGFVSHGFFQQMIPGLISGGLIALISFCLAYGVDRLQEQEKTNEEAVSFFINIHNEISANRLTLELESREEKPLLTLPLKTTAWDLGKNQIPVRTPQLLDGIKLLYDDIERYNWHVEYMRYKVMEKNLSTDNAPEKIWEPTKNILNSLCSKLKELERLTSRELVVLGQKKKSDYEKRFGKWEKDIWVSYFIKK